jgi:hypothetical protein
MIIGKSDVRMLWLHALWLHELGSVLVTHLLMG